MCFLKKFLVFSVSTAPIRRYADVVVHHQLLASLSEKVPIQIQSSAVAGDPVPLPESALMSVLNSEQLDSTGDDLAAEEVDDLTTPSKAVLDFSRKDAFLEKVSDEDLEIEKLIEDSCDVIDVESLKDVSSDEVSSSNALADLEIDDLIGDATDILIEGSMNDSASPEEDSEDLEIDTLIAGVENYAMQDDEASQLMVGPDSIAAKTEVESAVITLQQPK